MAKDRLINSTQGDSIITELRAMNTNLADIKSAMSGENNAIFVKGSGTLYIKSCLKEIIVPVGVIDLSTNCFADCSRLEKVVLNDELLTLSSNSFKNCAIATINLKNVTTIGSRVFEGCNNLTNLEIPNSVSYIDNTAFTGSSIMSITIHKPEDSISGAPWGATNATVIWDG